MHLCDVTIHKLIHNNIIGFSWEALDQWKEFLWLGIPGMVVFCSGWLAFEIGSFVSGSIDGVQLAAFTITLNLMALLFIVSILEWFSVLYILVWDMLNYHGLLLYRYPLV